MPSALTGRVLIVEPDAERRRRVRSCLAGWTVEEEPRPEGALETVRQHPPDLLLAGVRHGGLALLRQVRGDSELRHLPVILLGLEGDREACAEALTAGADDFLVEPIAAHELVCRAEARLRAARERRANSQRERDLLAEAHMAAEALERSRVAEEALRNSEERFRLASEAVSGLVYDWDMIQDHTRRSPGLRGLLGYDPEEVDHHVGWWTEQIHPDDWEAASGLIKGAVYGAEPLFSAEYRMRHRDGRWVHVWDRGFIVRDETGRPVRVVGSTMDISDRKHAEEELKAAAEAKDRFLATLSHELRTPLTPVLALVSSLQGDPRIPADLHGHLSLVRRNVELEARLIDDLLDLTRVASGKLELRCQTADVTEILAHALKTTEGELASRRLRLVSRLAEESLLVWADPPRLTQVFWNLLNNAAKFTPEKGTVTVTSRREGGEIVVEVADTGIGIDPEVLPRIFSAFEQADRRITRRFGGLGLGLSVSRAIVRLHGGDLTAASEGTGRGATFTVRLPEGVGEADPDDTLVTHLPEIRQLSEPAGLRLLLVEDHADTAEVMADLLRSLGHEVAVAGTVADALRMAGALEGLDLVISDLGLPDGSGLDVMRQLAGRGIRGIALSGYGMEEDVQRSREAGFEAHLTKPVSLQTLIDAIRGH